MYGVVVMMITALMRRGSSRLVMVESRSGSMRRSSR